MSCSGQTCTDLVFHFLCSRLFHENKIPQYTEGLCLHFIVVSHPRYLGVPYSRPRCTYSKLNSMFALTCLSLGVQ